MPNEVVIHVRGDTKNAEESITSLTRKITGISNTVTNLIAGGVIAMIGKSFYDAFADAERATAQLNAVLKSTQGVSGVTAEGALQLADAMAQLSGMDDEAILGAENLLLTFTRIGGEIFPQTTQAVLNMSVAMGQDLKSSAIQVGKALNEPIEGAAALRRVGIQLTDSQEALIKKMVESGDVMGAQKIILAELETEFGGAAEAAGNTLPGALGKLRTAFGNIQETMMGAVLPAITPIVQGFANWLPQAFAQTILSLEQLRAVWLTILAQIQDKTADFLNSITGMARVMAGMPVIGKFFMFDEIAEGASEAAMTMRDHAMNTREAAKAQVELANSVAANMQATEASIPVMRGQGAALENVEKAAKKAKTALQELEVSENTLRRAMEMAEFSTDEQRSVLEALGVAAIDAGPHIEGLSITAERLSAAFMRAGLSIDAANDAIGRIQASIAKKEADRLAEIAKREQEAAEAEAKRQAEELEQRTLDLGELMKGAFQPKGFDRFVATVMGSADIITDEAKAVLDDWRRQYFEFNRDVALLFEDLKRAGTQGSTEAVAKIKGIIAAFESLPDGLQGPLEDIKRNLEKMLEDFKLTSDGAVDLISRNHAQMVLIEQERIDELKRVQKQEFDARTDWMIKDTELSQRLAAAQEQETITKRKLIAEVNHSVIALGAEQELRKRALMESRKAEREARGEAQRGILQQVLGVLGFGSGPINPGMEGDVMARIQSGLAGANESQLRILDLLEALMGGSLKVEMDGQIVGRVVGRNQQERGRMLAAMGGY